MSGPTASRPPPPHVPPVTVGGVRFEPTVQGSTAGPENAPGVLGAYDAASGERLWTLKVYETKIDPAIEKDVQEDYIASLTATTDGKLALVTENSRKYLVDPAARSSAAQ